MQECDEGLGHRALVQGVQGRLCEEVMSLSRDLKDK